MFRFIMFLVGRNLEIKFPRIWTDGKAEVRRIQEEKKTSEKEDRRKEREKRKYSIRKGRKIVIYCIFPMIRGSGGSKSRLAKAAGAEPSGQMRDEKLHAVVARSTFRSLEVELSKKCTPLWREAYFQVNMYKAHRIWITFGSWDVEKAHAIVARSTLPSQKCKRLQVPEHFFTFRCRKSAH